MRIGPYEIHAVNMGSISLDGGPLFGLVPKTIWNEFYPADDQNRISVALRSLLIKGNGKTILLDAGIGNKFDEKERSIYNIPDDFRPLREILSDYEVSPDDVTDFIFTHLHFDHAGGATIRNQKDCKPTFPNAVYYVQQSQWEMSINPGIRYRASYHEEDYIPIKDAGQIKLLCGDVELYPGIEILVSDGHTPGLQMLKVSDGSTTLFFCSDAVPLASHLRLNYGMGFDINPVMLISEKEKFLKKAYDEEWIICFQHDPYIEAGTIKSEPKQYLINKSLELSNL